MAAIWGLAVPVDVVCPAIYPAPPGCTVADRKSAGVTWTAVITAVYVASIVCTVTLGRHRRWLTYAAISALVVVAIVGLGAVQNSTGYVLPY